MTYRSRLRLVTLIISIIGCLAGCAAVDDRQAAEWRRYNDYWSQRNCC